MRLYVGECICRRFETLSGRLDDFTEKFLKTLSPPEAELFVTVAEKFEKFTSDPENFPEAVN